ncbi:hypothetical protein [Halobacterium bonnevillei]|uniref:Uncharacterized protein n=1 Tax=Halobacterium bonnevillei TaxID=2692200 RepID=A0A6B0SCU5_9EURY|nr:hypothetical protein [Halobacterium bonnevillei]MXR19524.1 hypothetical protein [Halobacterium bonnevillei]
MTAAYLVILGIEGAVVALAGAVITATAFRNPEVVLYERAVGVAGLGLAAGGLGTVLGTAGLPALASVFVVAAALAFVLAGWRLAVDGLQTGDCVRRPHQGDRFSGGFEGERE